MSANHSPANQIQYSLMMKLPSQTIQRVKELQNEFSARFAFHNAVIAHPHITLAYWEMDPGYEARLHPRLEGQGSETASLNIRLNGFEQLSGAFCLKIENAGFISDAVFKRKSFLRQRLKMEARAVEIKFATHPHITIARKLTGDQLKIAGDEWQSKRFFHEFKAESMVLLRYLKNDSIQVVREFAFSGNDEGLSPHSPGIQTSLF